MLLGRISIGLSKITTNVIFYYPLRGGWVLGLPGRLHTEKEILKRGKEKDWFRRSGVRYRKSQKPPEAHMVLRIEPRVC